MNSAKCQDELKLLVRSVQELEGRLSVVEESINLLLGEESTMSEDYIDVGSSDYEPPEPIDNIPKRD